MKLKRIFLFGIVMIFMTGTLSTEAATTQSSAAFEPWAAKVIDRADGVYMGQHVSIDHYEYDGRAYVSYYDATNKDLKLAYEVPHGTGNCPGNADWACEIIDAGGRTNPHDVGQYSSIDVIDDIDLLNLSHKGDLNYSPHYAKIGISYYDATDQSLKFAMYSCEVTCGWTYAEVDDDTSQSYPGRRGQYSSFQFAFDTAATPIIYYGDYGYGTGAVRRALRTPASIPLDGCNPSWSCEVVAWSTASVDYGTHISADHERVAFYDPINGALVLAHNTGVDNYTCTGGSWMNGWVCEIIDNVGDVGKFASLYYDFGAHPIQIAYYEANNGILKYAIQTTPGVGNCTNDSFNCMAVDSMGVAAANSPVGISLNLDSQGEPIIAYQDFSDGQAPSALMLARPAIAYNELFGNCGYWDPISPMWQCDYLDGGGQYQNEADYVGVSVSPAGIATVAYYEIAETDQDVFEGRLKVAQQHFMLNLPLIIK